MIYIFQEMHQQQREVLGPRPVLIQADATPLLPSAGDRVTRTKNWGIFFTSPKHAAGAWGLWGAIPYCKMGTWAAWACYSP